ncbi:UvrD-helicase domain-containing protein [Flavobacterium sp. HNIBRBA15423]|uniref:UvrD-helicase domain-containing protein n=1 Tax=Flavobacterium sp. HNIBRBA15423 TaxID=3458683 RepID=UPI004044071F
MEIEKYIPQAEKIFLVDGTFKDDRNERIDFIKNFETCDLLAVPGSGKTTALIAKLYCIAQNMPFEDGSGILVLAHTNSAVDEIEKKLKKHCPQLFEYPNFVGTIQSFVNKYLAIPNYISHYKQKPITFDVERYEYQINKFYLNTQNYNLKNWLDKKKDPIKFLINIRFDKDYNLISGLNSSKEDFALKDQSKPTYAGLKSFKENLIKNGYLHFDDGYFLANKYLLKFEIIKLILQNRFKYVFIDEMQDLEEFQIKIIDHIFFTNKSTTVIQRLGDKNQSIYNTVKEKCDWETRQEFDSQKYIDLSFQNSLRLNSNTAKLVDKLVLERPKDYKVVGKFEESDLKPHLIVINRETTGEQIKNKFIELIIKYNLHQYDKNIKSGFKIISWITEKEEDNNEIYLQKLFSNYSKKSYSPKEDYTCLKDYLYYYDKEKKTLESIRKSILNSFVRILDLEDIKNNKGIRYRKSTLMQFIKNQSEDFYNDFKAKLYSWCFRIVVHQQNEEVYTEIVFFINSNDFIGLNWYNLEDYVSKSISKSNDFIKSDNFELRQNKVEDSKENDFIKIDLASVHAVKGQTHCATMYIETAYQRPIYETQKIIKLKGKDKSNPLLLEEHKCNGAYDRQALKMMYVGFSRPTHLLCFVALEENVKDYLDSLCHKKGGIWVIQNDLIQKIN